MTTVRAVAAHEVVRATYPREPTERDELGMATGKAIDDALSRMSYETAVRRTPTHSSLLGFAEERLDEELRDADLPISPEQHAGVVAEIDGVLRAFRSSPVNGLPRPRSRLVLIDDRAGVYAQPDYWDGRKRFFEMKSYRAIPPPPDVALQIRLFQLAFPECEAHLACFDRHSTPVRAEIVPLSAMNEAERSETLNLALGVALRVGAEKVLEYVDSRIVRYARSAAPGRT